MLSVVTKIGSILPNPSHKLTHSNQQVNRVIDVRYWNKLICLNIILYLILINWFQIDQSALTEQQGCKTCLNSGIFSYSWKNVWSRFILYWGHSYLKLVCRELLNNCTWLTSICAKVSRPSVYHYVNNYKAFFVSLIQFMTWPFEKAKSKTF